MSKSNEETNKRAGVIIIKNAEIEPRILGLRCYGSFDLPKGGVEPFENVLAAAIREAEEESGITDLNFRWGLITTKIRNVELFIAETESEPVIRPNPETGIYEHHGAAWLTFELASKKLHPYLRPVVNWVKLVLRDE